MRIALIGRTKALAAIGSECVKRGHEVVVVVTATESLETSDDRRAIEDFVADSRSVLVVSPQLDRVSTQLKALGTLDIGLSVNYVSILEQRHLDVFRLGVLNAHGGDLPRYRGNASQAWAILNGETTVALCIHRMVGGDIDSGDIICRERLEINEDTYIGDIYAWLNGLIPRLMVDAAERLDLDPTFKLEAQSQDKEQSLRTFPRLPEDRQILLTAPREQILRLIRASSTPFGGAYAFLGNSRIHLLRASTADTSPILSVPGQVTSISSSWFEISVADGTEIIRVTSAVMEDGRDWQSEIRSIRTRLR